MLTKINTIIKTIFKQNKKLKSVRPKLNQIEFKLELLLFAIISSQNLIILSAFVSACTI